MLFSFTFADIVSVNMQHLALHPCYDNHFSLFTHSCFRIFFSFGRTAKMDCLILFLVAETTITFYKRIIAIANWNNITYNVVRNNI